MTFPGALSALLLVAAPLVGVYLIFFGIPQLQHTRFRHQLWAIRDDLVDDVIDERLSMSPEARELLLRLHLAIKYAPQHTMRSGFTSALVLRGTSVPSLRKTLRQSKLPDAQRRRLLELYERMQQATTRHLLIGSPSGWLVSVAVQVVPSSLLERTLLRRARPSEVERRAEKELAALPRLYPESLSPRELASCAA